MADGPWETDPAPERKRRKKSEKRQRTHAYPIRFTPDEYSRLEHLARRRGLTRAGYIRQSALGDAGPRSQRRTRGNRQELAALLGEIGKIGSNINQIARKANTAGLARIDPDELDQAITDISDMRAMLLRALGKDDY